MLKKKQAGIPAPRQRAEARPQNVVNLMDALRRSLAEEKRAPAAPKRGRKRVRSCRAWDSLSIRMPRPRASHSTVKEDMGPAIVTDSSAALWPLRD